MNILVLASRVPATPSMPGSPRLYQFCRRLSQRHDLTLIVGNPQPQQFDLYEQHPEMRTIFRQMISLPVPPPSTWFRRNQHRLMLASHLRTDLLYPEYHREVLRLVESTLVALGPNTIVYVDGLQMTQYVPRAGDHKAIVDLHDCLSYLFAQQERLETHLYRKLVSRLETASIARWEGALHKRFAVVIFNSSVDEALYRAQAPRTHTMVISNGVDTEYYVPSSAPARSPVLLFTGVMDYGPNEDAAAYFCSEIFPQVRHAVPEAQFWIVGANPTARVQQLASQPGVRVLGAVPDMRPYLEAARVFVSPLRVGAGMKNKVLAALAMRLPVVATPISLANIDVQHGSEVLVAGDADGFARHVTDLLRDDALAARLGERGRNVVSERYSWNQRSEQLEEVLVQLLGHGMHPSSPAVHAASRTMAGSSY